MEIYCELQHGNLNVQDPFDSFSGLLAARLRVQTMKFVFLTTRRKFFVMQIFKHSVQNARHLNSAIVRIYFMSFVALSIFYDNIKRRNALKLESCERTFEKF